MEPIEALKLLMMASELAPLPKKDHALAEQAYQVLQKALEPKPEEAPKAE